MTDYYVANAPTGNDANNGTSELTPWETLDKADDGPYSADDQILCNKGDEWREQLETPSPGSLGSPITFGAYGAGDNPIINGSDLVTTWTAAEEERGDDAFTDESGTFDMNFRHAIPAAEFSMSGNQIRIQLRAHSSEEVTILSAYIGEKAAAGDVYDMETGTITEILFGGTSGATISAGDTLWSDWLTYSFDAAKDYIVSTGSSDHYSKNTSALTVYYKAGGSGDAGTANVTGYSTINNAARYLSNMAVRYEDVWKASFTPASADETDAKKVWLDGTAANRETSLAACTSANDFYYDDPNNTLYLNSASDPDNLSNPGIEANSRELCFSVNAKTYITVDGLDCIKALNDCVKFTGTTTGGIVQNVTMHDAAANGYLQTGGATVTLINCVAYDNGIGTTAHGFYFGSLTGSFNVDGCTAYDNAGWGFHCWDAGSGTIKNSKAYGNGRDGFMIGDIGDDANINLEYCIAYNNRMGFYILQNGATQNGNNDINLYNCVAYSNNDYAGFGIYDNDSVDTNIVLKNFIAFDNSGGGNDKGELWVEDNAAASIILDYNCYYLASGTMITYDGNTYTQAQFAAYQAAKSQDANSISADPLFVDAPNYDFTLQSLSPCINAGVDVGLDRDFVGTAVPQGLAPDIGAHEEIFATESRIRLGLGLGI